MLQLRPDSTFLELLWPVDVGNAIARELVRLVQVHIDPGCVVDRCQGLPS